MLGTLHRNQANNRIDLLRQRMLQALLIHTLLQIMLEIHTTSVVNIVHVNSVPSPPLPKVLNKLLKLRQFNLVTVC